MLHRVSHLLFVTERTSYVWRVNYFDRWSRHIISPNGDDKSHSVRTTFPDISNSVKAHQTIFPQQPSDRMDVFLDENQRLPAQNLDLGCRFTFQQDNHLKHTFKSVTVWLQKKKIAVLPWPSMSLDS